MNTLSLHLLILFCFGFASQNGLYGQLWTLKNKPAPDRNAVMWELGLRTGSAIALSDIDLQLGTANGFHLRKSLDYLFSLRADALYARFHNSDQHDGTTTTDFFSGGLQVLLTLNNFNWSRKTPRKFNLYAWVGGGANHYQVKVKEKISADLRPVSATQTHAEVGFGMAWKLNHRFNIALEGAGLVLFGNNADNLDGVSRRGNDVASFSSLRLNYNLGNARRRSQPLYWANPIDAILEHVTELKTPAPVKFSDKDHDGVLDELDLDPNTPPGVPVDTRGRPLDSDGDGLPDYEDPDPYIPFYNKNPNLSEEEIRQIVQEELNKRWPESSIDPEVINAFLPMVHFDEDSDNIRYADHAHLATVARLLERYPHLRLVVKGYTDRTASKAYNQDLSYRRAKAVIDYLVHVHGIERSRLLLQYCGEDEPLVPSLKSEFINRRVEFRIATSGDKEMEPRR